MQVFQGTAFSSKSPKEIHILKDYLFCIHADGVIAKIVSPEDSGYQPLLDRYQGSVISIGWLTASISSLVLSICMSMPRNGPSPELRWTSRSMTGLIRIPSRWSLNSQIIDTKLPSAKLPIFNENENMDDVFQKMMYLVRPEHIREVWVQGERVHSR